MPSENAWDCNHHPEWADDQNRCHHPAHDMNAEDN